MRWWVKMLWTYDANGGTGSMADATGVSGEYTLLANGFTAPDGKQFKAWSVGGDEKAVGDKITVTANTTVTAIWEAVEYNVTVTGGSASVGAGAPITKATMGTTVTLTAGAAPTGQIFDKWVVWPVPAHPLRREVPGRSARGGKGRSGGSRWAGHGSGGR